MMFPKLVPHGTSYVKIPVSKRAAMRIILETVQRGSFFWAMGHVTAEKALKFADKMAELYRTDANQAQRAYAKSKGRANSTLLMYPEDETTLNWWLLVTPGEGLVHAREKLQDAHDKRQRLRWLGQYELVHQQHTKSQGGGRHWTWQLTAQRYAELEASIQQLAASHGRAQERHDDLDTLVQAMMRLPGFHGVRQQLMSLYRAGRETWARTHGADKHYTWPEKVPYLDKGFACYHAPEPLRLDILVKLMQH